MINLLVKVVMKDLSQKVESDMIDLLSKVLAEVTDLLVKVVMTDLSQKVEGDMADLYSNELSDTYDAQNMNFRQYAQNFLLFKTCVRLLG